MQMLTSRLESVGMQDDEHSSNGTDSEKYNNFIVFATSTVDDEDSNGDSDISSNEEFLKTYKVILESEG
ncbi:hypothetical protein Golax_024311, partial [Gossypium laxum]|nr:hypothetical protein [Gossypium laxum]